MYGAYECIRELKIDIFVLKKGKVYFIDRAKNRLRLNDWLDIQLTNLQMKNFKAL